MRDKPKMQKSWYVHKYFIIKIIHIQTFPDKKLYPNTLPKLSYLLPFGYRKNKIVWPFVNP